MYRSFGSGSWKTLTLSEGGTGDRMEITSQDKRLDNIEIPVVFSRTPSNPNIWRNWQLTAFDNVSIYKNLFKPFTRIIIAVATHSVRKYHFTSFSFHGYKSNYQYIIHSIAGADWAEEVAPPFDCSSLTASFFATLTCSKLRIPSRPHRPIMALSW